MKRRLLSLSGWLLLGLASVGIFLPVLPTTPLVIAAAACFSFGNPKMGRRLESSRVFGPYIKGYRTGQGITVAEKARAIAVLWALLAVSAFHNRKTWFIVLMALIGTGVTIHLLLLKTKGAEG